MAQAPVFRPRFQTFLPVLFGLFLAFPAGASTLLHFTPDELATRADAVVAGRVIGLSAHPLGDIAVTDVHFEVGEAYKGPVDASRVFSVLGGLQGGRLEPVDGEPGLRIGDEVVVFLERNVSSGRTWILGGEQGCLGIHAGRLEATGLALAEFRARLKGRLAGGSVPLQVAAPLAVEVGPHILAITPAAAGSAADTPLLVELRGEHFGAQAGRVRFPDWFRRLDGTVLDWSDTLIHALAPEPDTGLQIEVTSGAVEVEDALGISSLERDGCPQFSCRPASYLDIVYNYPRFRWAGRGDVSWMFNWARMPDGCGMQAAGRAFQSWNDVAGSSFEFQFGGETQSAPGVHDGRNTVGSLSPWPFSHAWIAATIPWARYTKESAELLECDTGLNTDDFQFRCDGTGAPDQPDLQTIMLHEAGHWLRLRHVNSDEEIMQVASLLNRSRHELGAGDIRGVSHIYPGFGKGRLVPGGPSALCPAGDADSAVFEVTVTDAEGQPVAGVPASAVWADPPFIAGFATFPGPIPSTGPTDARGRTRIVLSALSGPLQTRSLAIHANGKDLPRPVPFEALSLDLSGDGRVGPEDILLAQTLAHGPAVGVGLDTALFRSHQGHSGAGGPPRTGKSVLSVSPTPFSTKVSMRFLLTRGGVGEVEILDVTGARVRRLWAGSLAPGDHSLEWDGRTDSGVPAASGVYVARVRVGDITLTRKVLRVR